MEDEQKKPDVSDPGEWQQMPMEKLRELLKEGIHIPKRGGGFYTFKVKENPFPSRESRKK